MRITVDRSRCDGLGICAGLAPDLFEIDDAGTLQVKKSDVVGGDELAAEQAVDACPTEALSLSG